MTNNVQNWGVLHLETNALSPDDGGEILKIHIINSHGKMEWERFYKPARLTNWEEAEAINGISPEMVSRAFPIEKEKGKINALLGTFEAVVVNSVAFTKKFLKTAGIDIPTLIGINAVFNEFMGKDEREFTALNSIMTQLGYEMPEDEEPSKARMLYWAYQKMTASKDSIIESMTETTELNGFSFNRFNSDEQRLEYLKSIGVVDFSCTRLPLVSYSGKFVPRFTQDVDLLGIHIGEETNHVVIYTKGKLLAIEEAEFIAQNQKKEVVKQ